MHALRVVARIVAALAFVSLLAACGGGGGGSGGGGASSGSSGNAVSGSVTNVAGAPLDAIPLALKGAATQNTATDTSGNYGFTGLANGKYVVMPVNTLYKFRPASRAIALTGTAVTNQNFTAKQSSSPSFTLSGVVSGAVIQNVIVTLNGDNTGSTFTDASGNYSFSGLDAGTYTVSAQSTRYSFIILNPITIVSLNSTANNFVANAVPSGTLNFTTVNPMPQATVGVSYSNTMIASISGGSSPYYYQSDTFANGAPPFGMIVDLNGNLTGTPTDSGQYTFGVCATDLSGQITSPCPTTTITVAPSAGQLSLSLVSVSCVSGQQNMDAFSYTVSVSGPVGTWVEDAGYNPGGFPVYETNCGGWAAGSNSSSCTRGSSDPNSTTAVFSSGAATGIWYESPIANYPFSGLANATASPTATCP